MTSTPITLTAGVTTTVDFTSPSTQTYGSNAQITLGSVNAMYAGDASGNKQVKYAGTNSDNFAILVTILNDNAINTQASTLRNVYSTADLDLNGTVKYSGTTNDRTVIYDTVLNNNGTESTILVQQFPN